MLRLLGVADLADRWRGSGRRRCGSRRTACAAARTGRPWRPAGRWRRPSGRSWRRRRAAARSRGSTVPTGMLRSGRLLPGLMSAPGRTRRVSPCLQPGRRDDVALLAVGVVQQRDARGAVRVVLDVRDLGRHAVLVVATEVDDAVGALVAAALVPGRDPAVRRCGRPCCAAGGPATSPGSIARDLGEVGDAGAATTRGRRLVLTNSPWCLQSRSLSRPPKMSMRSPARSVTIARLVFLRWPKPNRVRLRLPVRLSVLTRVDLDVEDLLDRDLDLRSCWRRGCTRNVYLPSSSRP